MFCISILSSVLGEVKGRSLGTGFGVFFWFGFVVFFLKSPGTSRALSPVGAWLSAGSSQALFRQQCRQGRQPAQLEHGQGAGASSAVREREALGCFG